MIATLLELFVIISALRIPLYRTFAWLGPILQYFLDVLNPNVIMTFYLFKYQNQHSLLGEYSNSGKSVIRVPISYLNSSHFSPSPNDYDDDDKAKKKNCLVVLDCFSGVGAGRRIYLFIYFFP